jgi:Tat protein translocase TatB subunit
VLNLGTGEVLVILVVALLVLGPDKLPGAARQAGRWLGELRRLSSGFQSELRDALQEPVDQTPRSTTTTATPPPQDEPEPRPGPGPGPG